MVKKITMIVLIFLTRSAYPMMKERDSVTFTRIETLSDEPGYIVDIESGPAQGIGCTRCIPCMYASDTLESYSLSCGDFVKRLMSKITSCCWTPDTPSYVYDVEEED